jgi:4-amino-4-deoxy-L-arabinose transferase-like glycosyltransferase
MSAFIYTAALFVLSAANVLYVVETEKRPPWWLLAAWAVFAVPVLFKAWVAVVLS